MNLVSIIAQRDAVSEWKGFWLLDVSRGCSVSDIGAPSDDAVVIQKGKKRGDPFVITVNCPDKVGLGCDICWIILDFGLYIVKGVLLKILSLMMQLQCIMMLFHYLRRMERKI